MSRCAGRDVLLLCVLAACGDDPDAHFEVTRTANQQVDLQLCEPARTRPCQTKKLFAATDAIATARTIDLIVTDGTPRLLLQFTVAAEASFCTQVALDLGDPIDGQIELPAEVTELATVENCASCTPGECE